MMSVQPKRPVAVWLGLAGIGLGLAGVLVLLAGLAWAGYVLQLVAVGTLAVAVVGLVRGPSTRRPRAAAVDLRSKPTTRVG